VLRRAILLASSAALALLIASSAQAATTLGQTGGSGACGGAGYSEIQTVTVNAPSYAVPASGTITSWSTAGNSDVDDVFRLKVFRPTSTLNQFVVVGVSTPQSITPNALNGPFPTSIPVQAGDLLGLNILAGASPPCTFTSGDSGEHTAEILPDSSVTGAAVFTTSSLSGHRVNVSATWEPPSAGCVVPKLKGKKLKSAKKVLRNGECRIGKVKGRKGGKVKKQNPKPGTVLPADSVVNLKLG